MTVNRIKKLPVVCLEVTGTARLTKSFKAIIFKFWIDSTVYEKSLEAKPTSLI